MDLAFVFLAILKQLGMRAEGRRFVGAVNQAVAGLADALVFGEAQPIGHRLVDTQDAVLRVQNGD